MTTAYDDPRRWWALAALGLAVLTLGFDITIMNVALPTIATELGVGTDGLQWMVNAYVLVIAGLMLTCGALGDRYGRKRLLLIGLGLFGISSAVAAGVDSAAPVIAARGAMGMGAAIMLPVAFAVLSALFGPAERGRAVSLLVMGLGVGIPLGPIIGGYLLDHFWWGSIFLINVPIAILGALAIAFLLPESRDPSPRRPDVLGAVLSTSSLTTLVYGLIEAPTRGWSDAVTLGTITAGLLLLVLFVAWELHVSDPMIDLHLFGRPQFLWASLAGVLVTFGMLGLLFAVPQYLQFVTGHDALGGIATASADRRPGRRRPRGGAARRARRLPRAGRCWAGCACRGCGNRCVHRSAVQLRVRRSLARHSGTRDRDGARAGHGRGARRAADRASRGRHRDHHDAAADRWCPRRRPARQPAG